MSKKRGLQKMSSCRTEIEKQLKRTIKTVYEEKVETTEISLEAVFAKDDHGATLMLNFITNSSTKKDVN